MVLCIVGATRLAVGLGAVERKNRRRSGELENPLDRGRAGQQGDREAVLARFGIQCKDQPQTRGIHELQLAQVQDQVPKASRGGSVAALRAHDNTVLL